MTLLCLQLPWMSELNLLAIYLMYKFGKLTGLIVSGLFVLMIYTTLVSLTPKEGKLILAGLLTAANISAALNNYLIYYAWKSKTTITLGSPSLLIIQYFFLLIAFIFLLRVLSFEVKLQAYLERNKDHRSQEEV